MKDWKTQNLARAYSYAQIFIVFIDLTPNSNFLIDLRLLRRCIQDSLKLIDSVIDARTSQHIAALQKLGPIILHYFRPC